MTQQAMMVNESNNSILFLYYDSISTFQKLTGKKTFSSFAASLNIGAISSGVYLSHLFCVFFSFCPFLLLLSAAAAAAKLLQSCLALCDPMDCSLPGSAVHGIFQARVLEWGAIAFSIRDLYLLLNRKQAFCCFIHFR